MRAELPKKIYERLPQVFGEDFLTSKLVTEQHSSDGTTTKLLIELQDGLRVEVRRRAAAALTHTEPRFNVAGKGATLSPFDPLVQLREGAMVPSRSPWCALVDSPWLLSSTRTIPLRHCPLFPTYSCGFTRWWRAGQRRP